MTWRRRSWSGALLALNLPDDTSPSRPITRDLREASQRACPQRCCNEGGSATGDDADRRPALGRPDDDHVAKPLLDALIGIRCVLWLTWRPDFVAPWLPHPRAKSSPSDCSIRSRLLIWQALSMTITTCPKELRRRIVKQADGIPLYLEELTRMFLDGTAREMTTARQVVPLPATLRDSLMKAP